MSVEICGLVIKWQLIGFLVAVLVYVTLVTVDRERVYRKLRQLQEASNLSIEEQGDEEQGD